MKQINKGYVKLKKNVRMRSVCIIIISLISLNTVSQTDSINLNKASYQVGILYSADYINKASYDFQKYSGSYGSSIGINFTKRIKKKFRLDTGIQF